MPINKQYTLPVGHTLTVTVVNGYVHVQQLESAAIGQVVTNSAPVVFGPYEFVRNFVVQDNGMVTVAIAEADQSDVTLAAAAAAALLAHVPVSGTVGDVKDYVGEGVPVNYTDGSPPATGEGVAGIGSRYTNITAGTLYLNTGTKAEPIWTQLAPVA